MTPTEMALYPPLTFSFVGVSGLQMTYSDYLLPTTNTNNQACYSLALGVVDTRLSGGVSIFGDIFLQNLYTNYISIRFQLLN